MKKLFVLLLSAMLLLSACGTADPGVGSEETTDPTRENTTETTQETAESQEEVVMAPNFRFYDREGKPHQLGDYRGKGIVLNFWASWCGPCKSEMAALENAYLAFGNDIEFVMVNLTDGTNETTETAAAYVDGQGFTFPIYFDSDYNGVKAYNVRAIPLTVFIDENGRVLGTYTGAMSADVLMKGIEKILNAGEQ